MTTAVELEKIVCRRCFAMLDVGDAFCRHCGVPTCKPDDSAADLSHDRSTAGPSLWENRWVVLAMLFLVLGPLGLPMLWRSGQFTPGWKVVLSVLVSGLTGAVIGMIWYVLQVSLEPLTQLRELQR